MRAPLPAPVPTPLSAGPAPTSPGRPGMIPAMSERGIPTVDSAPACPFVAFDDDRDGRALTADHRHRCFAEPRPAPRALAHQEAYCLSSAFPVCPTFQDWARREAAAARPGAAAPAERTVEPPVATPPPVVDAVRPAVPPETPQYGAPASSGAARRAPHRDWAAPPPWIAEADDLPPDDGAMYGSGDPYEDLPPLDDPRYADDDDGGRGPAPEPVEPPSFLAAKSATPTDPSRGLAGSSADRFAGGDPYAPRPASSAPPAPPAAAPSAVDDLDDWAGPGTAAVAAATARPSSSSSSSRQRYEAQRAGPGREPPASRRTPAPQAGTRDADSKRSREQDAQELFGPAWEPARRFEAYPSLRTRIGLPRMGRLPPLGLAAIALVVAAAVLFFIGPMLLGIGTKDDGGGSTPAPIATPEVTAEPEPTPVPEPTPQVYTIKANDTISKIAKKFGVSVEELLAANPQIKNPDRIKVGQEIKIPVPAAEDVIDETVDDGTVEDSAAP